MTDADRRRWTALIVEDDPAQLQLGAAMLGEFDLSVALAANADEALACLHDRSGEIALVLADVNLPGDLDGAELVRRVAILWPAVSLIVTSGEQLADGPLLPDHATFIPKPWRPLDIVAAVDRASRADHSVHAVRL